MSKALYNLVLNMSAGPTGLPPEVSARIKADFGNSALGHLTLFEQSHRSHDFLEFASNFKSRMRQVFNVPEHFEILFFHGGARAQMAAVPLNFYVPNKPGLYWKTGIWSKIAHDEAARFCPTELYKPFLHIEGAKDYSYAYYTDNETIDGTYSVPNILPGHHRVVVDMTSSITAYPMHFNQRDLIFFASQKALGFPGLTVVFIKQDWLEQSVQTSATPSVLNYHLQQCNQSMLNTPVTISWITAYYMLEWIAERGGLSWSIQQRNSLSKQFYTFLDNSPFYRAEVCAHKRSNVNIVFRTPSDDLDQKLCHFLEKNEIYGLKGHRLLGGLRANFYVSFNENHLEKLIFYLKEFQDDYQ